MLNFFFMALGWQLGEDLNQCIPEKFQEPKEGEIQGQTIDLKSFLDWLGNLIYI